MTASQDRHDGHGRSMIEPSKEIVLDPAGSRPERSRVQFPSHPDQNQGE